MHVTAVILTKNEERHIGRAMASLEGVADRIFVIDSESTDRTVDIARAAGAQVLVHPFVNQAKQFNWALSQLPKETDWIFRLDADEIVSPELAASLAETLPRLGADIAGVEVMRRMAFLGRPIRWGGVFPVPIVRLMRHGRGRSEDRWMDEHITVNGAVARLSGELLDDNLNPIGWWIDKHNRYASREVVELLNAEYHFLARPAGQEKPNGQAGLKRQLKEQVYARFPSGLRALAYFLYRYIVRLGFLDGTEGAAFHVLQGFWYRYLVDVKLFEVRRHIRKYESNVAEAIWSVLGIDLANA